MLIFSIYNLCELHKQKSSSTFLSGFEAQRLKPDQTGGGGGDGDAKQESWISGS